MRKVLPAIPVEQIQELIDTRKILLIDKEVGWTSHDVVNVMRGKTGVRRVGHAGTLDPMATGVLIVLVGREATRLQDFFLHMDKAYEFTAELGKETDTGDITGQVTHTWPWEDVSQVSQLQLESALPTFLGSIEQRVPAYSAVKIGGQKLYALARQGKAIETPSRIVRIDTLKLRSVQQDKEQRKVEFSCVVECSSGTYIRSLATDIGRKLGLGATITQLRRTRVGPFHDTDTQKLDK